MRTEEEKVTLGVKAGVIGIVLAILLMVFWPFKIIGAGHKGLVYNFGALQQHTLDSGLHFRIPIMQRIESVTTQPIQVDYQITVDDGGAITKDNQTVGSDTTIFFQYKAEELVNIRQNFGFDNIESLVRSAIKESFKETLGDYTIFDVAQSQEEIRKKITESAKGKLSAYPINVTEVRISNYDWSAQFDAQIQLTMERAQQVKQKEQELLIAEQEANKSVKQADAERASNVSRAEGERDAAKLRAEAKALEGEGIRQYNEAVAKNIELEVRLRQLEIEKIRAEKWNGVMVPEQVWTQAVPFSNK